MTLLATLLWPALAASLILGAGTGWLTGPPRTDGARLIALALVSAAGLSGGLALGRFAPGRTGLWLEGAALMLTAYLVGASVLSGAVLVCETARRPERP